MGLRLSATPAPGGLRLSTFAPTTTKSLSHPQTASMCCTCPRREWRKVNCRGGEESASLLLVSLHCVRCLSAGDVRHTFVPRGAVNACFLPALAHQLYSGLIHASFDSCGFRDRPAVMSVSRCGCFDVL
jgi:hypothetical protein